MKKLLFLLPAVVLMFCTSADKKMASMQGAYKMLTQSWNDGKKDTSVQASQLKIYTDTHLMYAGIGSDSVDYYGIGEYSQTDGVVTEKILFTASDSSTNNEAELVNLEITKTDKGYQQIIRDIKVTDGTITLTETYETASQPVTSPLDGAWKCTKYTVIEKGDTTVYTIEQYKFYGAGNFMYGNTYADSTKRKQTGIGYGTFEKINDSKIKETVMVSTYSMTSRTFELTIELLDDSHYRQTIVDGNVTQIEEYERLKKQ
jgi:hypothetical protein